MSQQQSRLSTAQAELSSVKESQENQRKKMTEMLRTLLADLGEVGQVIAKNQDPKRPEQGEGKIEGEFNRIVEKYQAKMGAMTDPDHADEETKAKHQANNKDTTGRDAKSQGKKPTKDHTETNGAANPDRAKKETEAKHQEDDEKGKTEAHNTKEAEHQEDDVKGKTKVHEQQEDAASGQLDGKERNLIRSNQPGPQEPKALFRPRGRGVTKNKITGQHRHNEDAAGRGEEAGGPRGRESTRATGHPAQRHAVPDR